MKKRIASILGFMALVTPLVFLTGCPRVLVPDTGSELTMLLAADDSGFTTKSLVSNKARVVQLDELLSLSVTVNEIALERVTDTGVEEVVILSEAFDVNLLDILNSLDLVDAAMVPEGVYSGAVLQLSSATAVFAASPEGPVAVELLDGGVLRVPTSFESVENGAGLLVFDLGAITLVELDAGGYQLVPDLQVDLYDSSVQAQARGEIAEVDAENDTLVLEKKRARLVVDVSQAAIFMPEDFDTPTGSVEDLTPGMDVLVFGALAFDGSITANVVLVLDREDEDDDHEEKPEDVKIEYHLINTDADPDAQGVAKYKQHGEHRKLEVKVKDVTLAEAVVVAVDGVYVGDAKVEHEKAVMKLHSEHDDVPEMTEDSVVEVFDATTGELLLYAEGGERESNRHDDDHEHDEHDDDDEHEDDEHEDDDDDDDDDHDDDEDDDEDED